MDGTIRDFVRTRAAHRCEYCHLPERFSGLRFHVEHIIPRQHQGAGILENLALACPECNFHKGTNLTGIDPDTCKVTLLFHPRRDNWRDHFTTVEGSIIGRTPEGRTTVWLLQMNIGDRSALRQRLFHLGFLSD